MILELYIWAEEKPGRGGEGSCRAYFMKKIIL